MGLRFVYVCGIVRVKLRSRGVKGLGGGSEFGGMLMCVKERKVLGLR